MTLTPSTTLVRSDRPLAARVDDEVVMLDPKQSAYFGLDDTASVIWDLLDRPKTVDELVAELTTRFDVAPDVCRSDITPFLTEMVEADLIILS